MTSIITGDIINSRKVLTTEWLPILKQIFEAAGSSPKTWEIFRGDSFQVEIKNVSDAFLFAIELKTAIKKIKGLDIRLAIGIGEKSFDTNNITEANGEAFINSGFAFDHLLKKQNLAIKTPWSAVDDEFNVSFSLALLVMDNWTVNSAEYVKMYLETPKATQKVIAKRLDISESSASERRKRAGFDEIMKLEKRFRQVMEQKIADS
ncbi:transcriptional regulator [Tenacibaculum sp. S7007]|uniref:Transcriptional regulator n=1 Tax=Tenacibaculum pelagium TaxID=2759527 RepID=A0A839ARY5_9FLAO|nr:SatD family protein [Tenacibaculum pelagium]MBA6157039.1 transcriptional regulator [Tenacibaculum pelagium]